MSVSPNSRFHFMSKGKGCCLSHDVSALSVRHSKRILCLWLACFCVPFSIQTFLLLHHWLQQTHPQSALPSELAQWFIFNKNILTDTKHCCSPSWVAYCLIKLTQNELFVLCIFTHSFSLTVPKYSDVPKYSVIHFS